MFPLALAKPMQHQGPASPGGALVLALAMTPAAFAEDAREILEKRRVETLDQRRTAHRPDRAVGKTYPRPSIEMTNLARTTRRSRPRLLRTADARNAGFGQESDHRDERLDELTGRARIPARALLAPRS